MKFSDAIESEIAKLVWVQSFDGTEGDGYERMCVDGAEGLLRSVAHGEAHAECEALREQIRGVARKAVAEREAEIITMIRDDFGRAMPLETLRGILRAIRARGAKP